MRVKEAWDSVWSVESLEVIYVDCTVGVSKPASGDYKEKRS